MITKKLLSDYLDEYKKGIHPLEFLLDMFTKYCDDSIPIEPPVKPVCETVVKQLRDIIKESSMEKRLLIFAIVTTGYCLSCGVDNPKCQCDNDE